MGDQNPLNPIDRDWFQPEPAQRHAQDPVAPEHREQPDHRHDYRQDKGRAQQRDEQGAAPESPPRQRAGDRDGKADRQERGQHCLHQREPDRRQIACAKACAIGTQRHRQQ